MLARRPWWVWAGFALITCLTTWPGVALAQEEDEPPPLEVDMPLEEGDESESDFSDDDMTLDEVVVTGSRSERLVDESPVAVEVIDRETIVRSGARNLAEVLEEQPGIDVSRSVFGEGVSFQGLDPEYVLILVDGERTIGRSNGVLDLSRFQAEDIDRIEIVKGASSALYGSDALGGVINIITRRGAEGIRGQARITYSNYCRSTNLELNPNTLDALRDRSVVFNDVTALRDPNVSRNCNERGFGLDVTGRVSGGGKTWGTRVSGGYHQGDAFDLLQTDINTQGGDFRTFNIAQRTHWEPTRNIELNARASFTQQRQDGLTSGTLGGVFRESDQRNLARILQASLSPKIKFGEDGSAGMLTIRGAYSRYDDLFQRDARASSDDDEDRNVEDLGELSAQYELVVADRHFWSIGFDGFYQAVDADRIAAQSTSIGDFEAEGDSTRDRFWIAPYTQFEWTVFDEDDQLLIIVPGARVDIDSEFGAQLSPKITVRYDPIQDLALRASYGMGFRAPTFREMWLRFDNPGVGYQVIGNPDLDPESSHNVNVSADYKPTSWLTLSSQFFYNELTNLIDFFNPVDPSNPIMGSDFPLGSFIYTNVGSARTMGVENVVRMRFWSRWLIEFGYMYLDTLNRDADLPLAGRAPHRITARTSFTQALGHPDYQLQMDLRMRTVVDQVYYDFVGDDNEPVARETPTYTVMDARTAFTLTEYAELFLGVENILDRGAPNGLILRPRTFSSGVAGSF